MVHSTNLVLDRRPCHNATIRDLLRWNPCTCKPYFAALQMQLRQTYLKPSNVLTCLVFYFNGVLSNAPVVISDGHASCLACWEVNCLYADKRATSSVCHFGSRTRLRPISTILLVVGVFIEILSARANDSWFSPSDLFSESKSFRSIERIK